MCVAADVVEDDVQTPEAEEAADGEEEVGELFEGRELDKWTRLSRGEPWLEEGCRNNHRAKHKESHHPDRPAESNLG